MITSEKTIDLLPFAIEIFEKTEILDFINMNKVNLPENITEEEKDKLLNKNYMSLITYLLKNIVKAKDSVFEMVAILQDLPIEEARKQSPVKLVLAIKEMLADPELMDFFKLAM